MASSAFGVIAQAATTSPLLNPTPDTRAQVRFSPLLPPSDKVMVVNRVISRLLLTLTLVVVSPDMSEGSLRQAQSGSTAELQARVTELESRVSSVEEAAGLSVVVFLVGCLCALWAQNTRRSAWLWFFLGVFFHVITLIVLLNKNAGDLRERSG
jgi:hypothetical protein